MIWASLCRTLVLIYLGQPCSSPAMIWASLCRTLVLTPFGASVSVQSCQNAFWPLMRPRNLMLLDSGQCSSWPDCTAARSDWCGATQAPYDIRPIFVWRCIFVFSVSVKEAKADELKVREELRKLNVPNTSLTSVSLLHYLGMWNVADFNSQSIVHEYLYVEFILYWFAKHGNWIICSCVLPVLNGKVLCGQKHLEDCCQNLSADLLGFACIDSGQQIIFWVN